MGEFTRIKTGQIELGQGFEGYKRPTKNKMKFSQDFAKEWHICPHFSFVTVEVLQPVTKCYKSVIRKCGYR